MMSEVSIHIQQEISNLNLGQNRNKNISCVFRCAVDENLKLTELRCVG